MYNWSWSWPDMVKKISILYVRGSRGTEVNQGMVSFYLWSSNRGRPYYVALKLINSNEFINKHTRVCWLWQRFASRASAQYHSPIVIWVYLGNAVVAGGCACSYKTNKTKTLKYVNSDMFIYYKQKKQPNADKSAYCFRWYAMFVVKLWIQTVVCKLCIWFFFLPFSTFINCYHTADVFDMVE